jgi:hypothetical protein
MELHSGYSPFPLFFESDRCQGSCGTCKFFRIYQLETDRF